MVASLFQARSGCLSTHVRLDHLGTLDPHVSGPHHPTMGGTLDPLIDTSEEGRPVMVRYARANPRIVLIDGEDGF